MKKRTSIARAKAALKKPLLIMKLTILLVVFCTFHASAGLIAQKISFKANDSEIAKVLTDIQKQGDYRFLFNSSLKDLKLKVSVSFEKAELDEVLKQLFSGTTLTYTQLDNNLIAIRSNNPEEKDIRITGRVTSETGDPISAASVVVKGTSTGTITDGNGNFSLNVPDNAVLVISAVGYNSVEVSVAGKQQISVKLEQSTRKMDEVVVIGYGTASKRDLTGSIVKVAGKEVADKPNTNPVASLQSKVAGLYVVNNGTPGASPDIRIRGTVSIGQVHPLYIVDGIFNDNIDYLNPNDIESVEVLKDPSSLAIFGVKGATGAIVITTKKAKIGQTIVNFNTTYGYKTLVDKIKMANASQFATLFAHEMATDGNTVPDYSAYNSNTDWISAVTRKGIYNSNNLTVSGTTERNKYSFGLGYISDEGIIIHERLQKFLLSFSDEFKINNKIKIGFNFNGSRQNNPYDASWVLDDARKVLPVTSAKGKLFKVRDPYTGDSVFNKLYSNLVLQGSGVVNPVLQVENEWNKTISTEYRYVGSVYADINILKNLNFRSTWYGDMSNLNVRKYQPLYYAYSPQTNAPFLYSDLTSLRENDNDWKKFQQDYILTYKKSFGEHNLTAMGGFTTYYFGNFNRQVLSKQGTDASALPIPNDKRFWYVTSGPWGNVDPTSTNSSQNEYTTVSELVRVLYNYNGKYYFNASLRDDASSRLPFHKHQKFWALGGAWEISKENFMANQSFFDFLKLKASVGTLGNQTSSYLDGTPIYYPSYPGLANGTYAVFGTYAYNAAQPAYEANPDLRWETVNASEIGVEFNAFQHRLFFEANYYNKVTKDLMTMVSRTGQKDELINGGSLRNWGEEFTATWNQKINKDFSISINGNITFMKNKVLSLASDLPSGVLIRGYMNNGSAEARTMPGQPIASFYGYVVNGIIQSYADKLAYYPQGGVGDYGPGDFKFKDIAGGAKGGPDSLVTTDDRQVIGNPSPDFIYGGSVSLNYKQFTLSVDLGGVYGNEIFRTWGSLESPFQRVNYPAFKVNSWYGAGTSNWDPVISQGHRFNYNGSTYNIEDGSYFRVRNLQLAYNFDTQKLSKSKIKNLRVFFNIQNLKTWKHNSGYSPEYGGDATGFGFDFGGNALPRVTTMGLNVTF